MKNINGFSLIELLIGILIAAILILTVGVLSSIAGSTFNKLNSEQQTHNDISYGLKLMQNRVRGAQSLVSKLSTKPNPPWVNQEELIADNAAFGIYQVAGNAQKDFVYLADKTDESKREIIFSSPDGNLGWTVNCNPNCTAATSVVVTISGTKNKVPFNMGTTILRRNP